VGRRQAARRDGKEAPAYFPADIPLFSAFPLSKIKQRLLRVLRFCPPCFLFSAEKQLTARKKNDQDPNSSTPPALEWKFEEHGARRSPI
jgi:hypothetical protein